MSNDLIVKPDNDVLAKLRQGSGEGSGIDYPFVPLITIDNQKVKEDVNGREVDVLCEPRYQRLDKIGEDFLRSYMDEFKGVVLVVKWQVYNKGAWDATTNSYVDNGAPQFASRLFSPEVLFGHKTLTIKYKDSGETEELTYPELKAKFSTIDGTNPDGSPKKKSLFKLECTMFVKVGDEIVRVKFKGASRGAVFDYKFKSGDSISAHQTRFFAEYNDKPQPHNISKLEVADDGDIDWAQIVADQEEINKLFTPKTEIVDIPDEEVEIIDPEKLSFE